MSLKRESPHDVKFHKAAINGDLSTIIRLLETGRVHVDCRDADGTTPLMFAVAGCHLDCTQELIDQGADCNAKRYETKTTPLFLCAQNGDIKILRILLKSGAIVDQPNIDGGTPLFIACQQGHEQCVRELLEAGANPNSQMKDGSTPIFISAQNGHCIITKILINRGVKVDSKRRDKATPLWIACQLGWTDVCSTLLNHGADVNSLRIDGASPLYKASHKGYYDIVRVILRYKPFLGVLPIGESALHVASMFGHFDICKRLIKAGSDPLMLTKEGETAYQVALKNNFHRLADYLKDYEQIRPISMTIIDHQYHQRTPVPNDKKSTSNSNGNPFKSKPNGGLPSSSTTTAV